MASLTNTNDAVRIQVIQQQCNFAGASQCCKFSVDPQLTTIAVLHNLITRAFKLNREFETSYLARDDKLPEAMWCPLLSDFDLQLAFKRCSVPHLLVKVEYGRSASASAGSSSGSWSEGIELLPRLPPLPDISAVTANNYSVRLPGLFREKMEKTIGLMQKALNWPEELAADAVGGSDAPRLVPPPLDDLRFQSFLDNVGVMQRAAELRKTVYLIGLEPSLRKVAWKHLLDVYPEGLTGRERLDYMKMKAQEYYKLRDTWQKHLQQPGQVCEEVSIISNMVRKDVLRTDRQHPYFSGSDDNPNTTVLYNILTTYSLNHPSVGYCQGMSDLASPLLVTQRDEGHAYVCFCALMSRTHLNFHIDGDAMSLKFQHLSEALLYYDPDFYLYLQEHQADDLLFCYRWLLLELKREFAFDDAQTMLEVLWATLPPRPPQQQLHLYEVIFNPEASLQAAAANTASFGCSHSSTSKSPSHHKSSSYGTQATITQPSARILSRVKSLQRISNYGTVCALRRQRSSEAAVLSRHVSRRSRPLTRALSQPVHSRRFYPNFGACVDTSTQNTADTNTSAVLSLAASKDLVKKKSGTQQHTVLSPLSDDVFLGYNDNDGKYDAGEASSTNSKLQDDADAANVTPTRKIKNLKEFMVLGKNPASPSKSPKKDSNNCCENKYSSSVCNDVDDSCANNSSVSKALSSDHSLITDNDDRSNIPLFIQRPIDFVASSISTLPNPIKSKPYNCLTGDVREFPPSGLTPTESPCDNSSISSCHEAIVCNGSLMTPTSNGFCTSETFYGTSSEQKIDSKSGNLVNSTVGIAQQDDISYTCDPNTRAWSSTDRYSRFSQESTSSPSTNSSTCSSVLCEAETARRCFSESDAGLGLLLDCEDDRVEDEELCVEVWENPVASSPIRDCPPKLQMTESCTENDISKLLSSRDQQHSSAHFSTVDQRSRLTSLSDDSTVSLANISKITKQTDKKSANTGWTVGLGSNTSASSSSAVGATVNKLCPPEKFGGGNPFLMIVCVTILLQHRSFIISQRLDHNDLAMHFDKMVRKHNVHTVLRQARVRYHHYCSMFSGDSSSVSAHQSC
uniref:TBC1 domain family member 25 n=2 Tax=Hirondellea gigas TaxID=1518452 RepID=A0A2P2I736_9CRUS